MLTAIGQQISGSLPEKLLMTVRLSARSATHNRFLEDCHVCINSSFPPPLLIISVFYLRNLASS